MSASGLVSPGSLTGGLGADYAADGAFLAVSVFRPSTGDDIWILSRSEPERRPLVTEAGNQTFPRVSPRGDWIAYQSTQTGQNEVYAVSTEGDRIVRVSAAGGTSVAWRGDGRELYYSGADGRVMAVPVLDGAFTSPEPLFELKTGAFLVAGDGREFLVSEEAEEETFSRINVALNLIGPERR